MCQPYRGAQNQPWRSHGGAYGLHAPHSGEAQKLPFLALPFLEIPKYPKKAIFAPPPNGGHGARMDLTHISRGHFGHPGRADTCRDSLNGCISACVSPTGVPKIGPGDVRGAHTGSMPPIWGRPKNCLFWYLPFLEISKWPKKAIFGPPPNGGHGARMHLHHISRGHFSHPRRADTCRDIPSPHISACVNDGGVPPDTPGDVMGAHTGSTSPIRGRPKNCLF